MIKAANDNFPPRRIMDPFHRLFVSQSLDKDPVRNAALYYIGQRYQADFEKTGRSSVASPDYGRPMVSCGQFDATRDTAPAERFSDKSRPYFAAATVLDTLGLRSIVEAILLRDTPLETAGKAYSGRNHAQQARAAAITALSIGLRLLEQHYVPAKSKAA